MTTSNGKATLGVGAIAGLVGGVTSWIYELVVWVHLLHLKKDAYDLVASSASLAFGNATTSWPASVQFLVGAGVHLATSIAWGIAFAMIWPYFRRRQIEATLVALFFGVFAWIFMHNVVLAAFAPNPPSYTTYSVLNGFVSHTFGFSVPIALVVKRWLR